MAVAGSLTYDTKLDTNGFKKGLSKVGDATKTTFKVIGGAVAGIATAIGGITVASTKAYAEYEQLTGGVETLFAESEKEIKAFEQIYGKSIDELKKSTEGFTTTADEVMANAQNAYKTAGMSANEYMKTVTSFSASLRQNLKDDSYATMEYADMAVIDMADNANKMGTSMEAIQNAYQGFAKQNFTMLDNLKLGYGGTKTEMERLLADATKISGIEYDVSSFADIVEAIHVMQVEMGIAGTTAKEASTTISGSIQTMKGAFDNLLVGLANGDANLDTLITNLFDSISTVATNIIPVVMTILEQVPTFIIQLITVAVEQIPMVANELIPSILNSAVTILNTLIQGIMDNLGTILATAIEIILSLIKGITKALPELIPVIVDAVILIVETLIDNIDLIIEAGVNLIIALTEGIFNALPDLIARLPELIIKLAQALLKLIFIQIPQVGQRIVITIIEGLFSYWNKMIEKVKAFFKGTIFEPIINKVADMGQAGLNLVQGLWNGILGAKDWLLNKIKGFATTITQGIKDFFGIKSPSKVMRDQVGQWLPKGIAVGIDANTDSALNSIDKMNDEIMNKMTQAVSAETARASFSGTTGSVSQILSANSVIQVENYNKLYLDGEQIHENQQTVQQRKDLQYSFGGGSSK